ncbi:MAG: hypothetical protein GJ676_01950 [Rhodobacteraceae bacterium]|nr:hypothetical protein [Paracoccaceae bacterium]
MVPTLIEIKSLETTNNAKVKADCTLTSPMFTVEFTQPTKLNLPSYGSATPPAELTCTSSQKTYTKTIKATNLTQLAYQNEAVGQALFGFGLAGIAVSQTQAANRDKSKDVYGYPPLVRIAP